MENKKCILCGREIHSDNEEEKKTLMAIEKCSDCMHKIMHFTGTTPTINNLTSNVSANSTRHVEDEECVSQTAYSEDERKKTFLDKFSDNLTKMAKNHINELRKKHEDSMKDRSVDDRINFDELNPNNKFFVTIGREKEIKRLQHILCRKTKNNPVLLGLPGIGKSAIVEGLAQLISDGDVPYKLKDKQIYSLNVNSIIAGTKFRGEFEERFQKIIDQVIEDKNIILFIDEIHNIVGAGSSEGSGDIAQILKPYLARGEVRCIGATTSDEYRKIIEKDAALERRFTAINVKEPSNEEAIDILNGLKKRYEKFHCVTITEDAINSAVTMSSRYINDRYLPDKAIDLIDEAGAKLSLTIEESKLNDIKEKLLELRDLRENVKQSGVDGALSEFDAEIEKCKIEIKKIKDPLVVTKESISEVLSLWTGIPTDSLSDDNKKRMINLEDEYKKYVIGQERAVKALSDAIRMSATDIKSPELPIGVFIFAGPSGVGKTWIAKTTAKLIFNSDKNMIRIDMSEYMEKHSISKLIGSPPGYVGHDDSNQLCEKIRKNPYQLVLFDEIEKAHPDIFNLLLQLLDDGHLTDSKGRRVDFKNTIICMTTNLGTSNGGTSAFGFVKSGDEKESEYKKLKTRIEEALKNNFRPEFLNRVDESIVFSPLSEEDLFKIVDLLLVNIKERLETKGISIEISKEVKEVLVKDGLNKNYGARPLRRAIKQKIETPVAMNLLDDTFKDGDTIYVKMDGENIIFVGDGNQ